jgi:hypothetical protein
MSNKSITQYELKSQLSYDENTGIFTRIIKTNNRRFVGEKAGFIAKDGYLKIGINRVSYPAHCLAWLYVYGEYPKLTIDHINLNKQDNKISNLRLATDEQQTFNKTKYKNNKCGLKGVFFVKNNNKFRAMATLNKKKIHLGYFTNAIDAFNAYNNFALSNHGEFYCKVKAP